MEDNKIIRMFDKIIKNRYDDDLTNNINKIYEDFYNDNLLSYGNTIDFFKVLKDDDEEDKQEAYNNFDYKEITNIDVDTCQTINIPSFVTNLNPTKFIAFKNLKELFIENGNRYLSQSNNTLPKVYLNSSKDKLYSFSNALKEVIISNLLDRVGNSAFEHCINLETVTFEKDFSSNNTLVAGSRVFSGCYRLKKVNIKNTNFLDNYRCDNYSCPFMYGAKAYINGKEVTLNCKKHSKCYGCDIGPCVQNKV